MKIIKFRFELGNILSNKKVFRTYLVDLISCVEIKNKILIYKENYKV